jgi:hypothetical protein
MYSNTNLHEMYNDMEHDLAKLYSWFYDNCLTVNPDKTSYVIFKDPRKQIAYNILDKGQSNLFGKPNILG